MEALSFNSAWLESCIPSEARRTGDLLQRAAAGGRFAQYMFVDIGFHY